MRSIVAPPRSTSDPKTGNGAHTSTAEQSDDEVTGYRRVCPAPRQEAGSIVLDFGLVGVDGVDAIERSLHFHQRARRTAGCDRHSVQEGRKPTGDHLIVDVPEYHRRSAQVRDNAEKCDRPGRLGGRSSLQYGVASPARVVLDLFRDDGTGTVDEAAHFNPIPNRDAAVRLHFCHRRDLNDLAEHGYGARISRVVDRSTDTGGSVSQDYSAALELDLVGQQRAADEIAFGLDLDVVGKIILCSVRVAPCGSLASNKQPRSFSGSALIRAPAPA